MGVFLVKPVSVMRAHVRDVALAIKRALRWAVPSFLLPCIARRGIVFAIEKLPSGTYKIFRLDANDVVQHSPFRQRRKVLRFAVAAALGLGRCAMRHGFLLIIIIAIPQPTKNDTILTSIATVGSAIFIVAPRERV